MNPGERLTETPPGVRLVPLDAIPDGGARNFVLQMKAGRFHGFVVRKGDRIFGYRDRCPHMGLPLAQELGALFDIESGRCVGGPCAGARLTPWPVAVADGNIMTA